MMAFLLHTWKSMWDESAVTEAGARWKPSLYCLSQLAAIYLHVLFIFFSLFPPRSVPRPSFLLRVWSLFLLHHFPFPSTVTSGLPSQSSSPLLNFLEQNDQNFHGFVRWRWCKCRFVKFYGNFPVNNIFPPTRERLLVIFTLTVFVGYANVEMHFS